MRTYADRTADDCIERYETRNKMRHIKNFLHNINDVVLAIVIVALAAGIIYWRLQIILDYPKQLAEQQAVYNEEKAEDAEAETEAAAAEEAAQEEATAENAEEAATEDNTEESPAEQPAEETAEQPEG
jgi:cytoskeletal protein RodZ